MSLLSKTKQHAKHLTVTGYVVNSDRTKLLMIRHNKLGKWLPPGGHLEADEVPHEGAIREVLEETGVAAAVPATNNEPNLDLKGEVDTQIPRPYAMMYQVIPANKKEGEHIHLDMVYVLEADEAHATKAQEREVSAAEWLTKAEILATEEVFDAVKGFAKLNLV